MDQVIGTLVGGYGPPVAWRQVLEQLHAGPGRPAQRGDPQPRAEDVVEVLLLRAPVLAGSGHMKAQHVPIDRQADIGVPHHDGGVVDAEEEPVRRLPARVALAARKL